MPYGLNYILTPASSSVIWVKLNTTNYIVKQHYFKGLDVLDDKKKTRGDC